MSSPFLPVFVSLFADLFFFCLNAKDPGGDRSASPAKGWDYASAHLENLACVAFGDCRPRPSGRLEDEARVRRLRSEKVAAVCEFEGMQGR